MPQLTEQQVREIVRNELLGFLGSDRYTFQKDLQIFDGRNFQLASGTGTKIGTASSQKLGFFGATPAVQQSAVTSPTSPSGTYVQAEAASAKTAIDQIKTALTNLGLTA